MWCNQPSIKSIYSMVTVPDTSCTTNPCQFCWCYSKDAEIKKNLNHCEAIVTIGLKNATHLSKDNWKRLYPT
jgi:hypothetical protein